MSTEQNLAGRMAHLGSMLKGPEHDFDRGYHMALDDVRSWIEFDEKDTDDLLHEVECYLDSPDNWPTPEDEHPLDVLHRRLVVWEETQCDDPDRTVTAWRYMGILSAAVALAEQGVPLPQRWMDDQIDAVRELIGDERCGGCAELFVPGECIPCESCGASFCPSCEGNACEGGACAPAPCGASFMAGTICARPAGHEGAHA